MAKTKNTGPKARNDAYTGLLAISFLSLVGATVLMAMDASELGTPPAAVKVDAPGSKVGASGENFKRTDTSKIDTTPNEAPNEAPKEAPKAEPKVEPDPKADPKTPDPKADPKVVDPKAMSRLTPAVDVPNVAVPPVVQVGATEPAADIEAPKPLPLPKLADLTEPPVQVKPFLPPM